MPDFLFVTLDAGGNLPPALGVARELLRDGHRVRFLGYPQQEPAIEAAGAEFRPYRNAPRMTLAEQLPTLQQVSMLVSVFGDAGIAGDLLEEARRDPPDVVVVDCLLLGALDAAARAGLRTAALVHSFYAFFDGPFRRTPITAALAARGLGPRRVMNRADRILVCSDRFLDPAAERNGHGRAVWCGPVVDVDGLAAPPHGTPRVLVSLSTTALPGQEAFLQKTLDAVAAMPLEVVVTTGPAIDPVRLRAPANTTVHRYLPHKEVMPGCSAVIGHGGHATTMLALAHGLPLVMVPMHPLLDQHMVGRAVHAAGAGLLAKASSPKEEIALAVATVVNSAIFHAAASAVGRRIREAEGARTGARLLADLVADRQP